MSKQSKLIWPNGSRDPLYNQPYIDIDEWRDEPVRHRYVHGGFEDTECRFSFYFPPAELYEGRFFQPLMAVSGLENAANKPAMAGFMMANTALFAISSGGYLVESNQGLKTMFPAKDPTITGYRASAAAARFSRVVAAEMYGPHRPYGYCYGGSGGAYKTISCVENCFDVWDGCVPFVMPSPLSIPNNFTVQAHAIRILEEKFPKIVDALDPGGSGDMYAKLNNEEREALAEVTRMGFPPLAWFHYEQIAVGYTGVFSMFIEHILNMDPEYLEDFWKVPGYLGANPTESLLEARVHHKTKIKRVIMTSEAEEMGMYITMPAKLADSEAEMPALLQIESMPEEGDIQGAFMNLTSGDAAGHSLSIAGAFNDLVFVGFSEKHFRALTKIKAGDELTIDNSTYLAVQTYHRHQVPSPDYYIWDQFRAAGKPIYPQRPVQVGLRQMRWAAGSVMSGRFAAKMIVVHCLMDEAAYPWHADWYRTLVKKNLGDRLDDQFRLWYVENGMHTTKTSVPLDPRPVVETRVVPYTGVVEQALRDVSAWVEKGIAPPPSTNYKVIDGQIQVPPTAEERKGVQPVIIMKTNGSESTKVSVGETVEFSADIVVPSGAGTIIKIEWDFDGSGEYPDNKIFDDNSISTNKMTVKTTHAFSKSGTFFPALRVTSQRQGDYNIMVTRVQNLGRVRVVVK